MQTLSRAHNRLLRLTPSWSTKAWWKQAKQTKKQVIIPLLFLLKYQTLYYILVFVGGQGEKDICQMTVPPRDRTRYWELLGCYRGAAGKEPGGEEASPRHTWNEHQFFRGHSRIFASGTTPTSFPKSGAPRQGWTHFRGILRNLHWKILLNVFRGFDARCQNQREEKHMAWGYRCLNLPPSFHGNSYIMLPRISSHTLETR